MASDVNQKPMLVRFKSSKILWRMLIFTIVPWSASADAGCSLDFRLDPSIPLDGCIVNDKDTVQWQGITTTGCCLSPLITLTEVLALSAKNPKGSIFMKDTEEAACENAFRKKFPAFSVNVTNCGFERFKSGQGGCSDFSIDDVANKLGPDNFRLLQKACDERITLNETGCRRCKDQLGISEHSFSSASLDKPTREICDIALLIATAAPRMNDSRWARQFYGCIEVIDLSDRSHGTTSTDIKLLTGIGTTAGATAIALLGIVLFLKWKRRTKGKTFAEGKDYYSLHRSGLYRFSYEEISNAISYTSPNNFLGEGNEGRAYKGILPSGQYVAIKHISRDRKYSRDGFLREVTSLSRVRHPNLVSLLGYCDKDCEQFLVYEFCCNGNLAQLLWGTDKVLTWQQRVKIARDSARALRFLHSFPEGCVVHRDIKPTNILLNENMDAKLSGFRLSKMFRVEESNVYTAVKGTVVYLDPEYFTHGRLTTASDRYSFGIVLLQLLSGTKCGKLNVPKRDLMVNTARLLIEQKGDVSEFADQKLNGEYVREAFELILNIAVLCTASSSRGRPDTTTVFYEMQKAWEISRGTNLLNLGPLIQVTLPISVLCNIFFPYE